MPTVNLDHAIVYDVETLKNCFTLNAIGLFSDVDVFFEISDFRDDRAHLFQWFNYWRDNRIPMIGFNNIAFDYPIIHRINLDPYISVDEIFEYAQAVIADFTRSHTVWESDRFAPQIDLFKIHHFDNRAKSTSLKALEVNMRSESVLEMPLPWDKPITREQVETILVPYNRHDAKETRKFARISLDAIKFRVGLAETLRGDVLNFNDTKIGAKILEQRLGDELCYERDDGGRRQPRQTFRTRIPLNDIIFSYIQFRHPEFNRVLMWMRTQTLSSDELSESQSIRTKGVFTGVKATIKGFDYYFGTGGIHGSVSAGVFSSDDDWIIQDIDVAGLYPSIAIVNQLAPEHLGKAFVREYAQLPIERAKHKKGTVQNAAFKLAANGTYGNSNNPFSVFYDPKFTMSITINGQLMLCMLAEWMLDVWSLEIIQINTDGITYRCHRSVLEHARIIQRMWERTTKLALEETQYARMWIRDVNNYVAQDMKGKLKKKGAYWFVDKFPDDISNASPPAWHKDFSAAVCTKAAVAYMVEGKDIEQYVYEHRDPFDFMCRTKVDRSSHLYIGDHEVQRITRYYIANSGGQMRKISPPPKGAHVGEFKRRNGISDSEYWVVANTLTPGTWDARIHTKNKSTYQVRETSIESGFEVAECNVASHFDFGNLNYDWYIAAAEKLVVR